MDHEFVVTGRLAMKTLFIRPEYSQRMLVDCIVIQVSHLRRELVLRVVSLGSLAGAVPEPARLAEVLIDELVGIRSVALQLPLPRDPRARRVALEIRADPSCQQDLATLAEGSGASARTLERLFQRETGMTVGRWRQQARLLKALGCLAEGASVTTAALDVITRARARLSRCSSGSWERLRGGTTQMGVDRMRRRSSLLQPAVVACESSTRSLLTRNLPLVGMTTCSPGRDRT